MPTKNGAQLPQVIRGGFCQEWMIVEMLFGPNA
jgi:hypothetical protein